MKKKLNETDITNELRGASLFFQPSSPDKEEEPEPKPRRRTASAKKKTVPIESAIAEPEVTPVEQNGADEVAIPPIASPAVETVASAIGYDQQSIESIRKAVKRLGKESTFCRFTQEEKNVLGDIVYTYKRNGVRTSENEVIRIAVNWLIENYRADGRNSVLAQVLHRLSA